MHSIRQNCRNPSLDLLFYEVQYTIVWKVRMFSSRNNQPDANSAWTAEDICYTRNIRDSNTLARISFDPCRLLCWNDADAPQWGNLARGDLPVDTDKYYQLTKGLFEEIQISENEIATDPDRHRSLSRHRRIPDKGASKGLPRNGPYESSLSFGKYSIFLRIGPAVII